MIHQPEPTPSFWTTVRLLLRATRKRSTGRRKRQRELLQHRSGKQTATDWSVLGFAFTILLMIVVNVAAAFTIRMAVTAAQRVEAERHGKLVVSSSFLRTLPQNPGDPPPALDADSSFVDVDTEARHISERYGGNREAVLQKLQQHAALFGAKGFVTLDEAAPGPSALLTTGALPRFFGSLVLAWWAIMLIFQGEGLELDLQRRRHPMWEWLFTHPVPAGAIFFAEMISPLAANPIFWAAPLFPAILYDFVYGPAQGVLAFFLIGPPLTVAVACLGKALENGTVLRFPPRTRGAVIGIMSWLGYSSMMLFVVALLFVPKAVTAIAAIAHPFTLLPWPWLTFFLGGYGDSFSFPLGVLTCWLISVAVIAGSVSFSVWAARQGLSGNFAASDSRPSSPQSGPCRFGKDPLYRKEFLWFRRDRSAIVQTILIPITLGSLQAFNLRGLLSHAQNAWNYLCGAAIFFGTYFLWILGPKSLASEGSALWIALTWPRGLESLLKAKAWLWSLLSTGMVALVLAYAVFLFPYDFWKIALLGAGWFVFARSMAEKSVTLVTITSDSGEVSKIPSANRWAAQLGMLTFAIGVITEQWHIAVMGIVYSWITAAAMWQNFRARLPFLYDPWSEVLPAPPTLMHAMIAISILVEGGAVVTGILSVPFGRDNIAVAQAMAYGLCSVAVAFGTSNFLRNRDVPPQEVWFWPARRHDSQAWWRILGSWFESWLGSWDRALAGSLLAGLSGGLLLGLCARGYLAVLAHIPATAEILRKAQQQMAAIPNLRLSYAIMAVLFAPFAEEYLFRGLLFRALDREWGGWRAILGSAAFFAIYHPALSWPPVFALGVANALLFKKTGRLAPAVLLHMAYNAIVLS